MLLEIALALVLGAVIYHYIFKKKEETLQMEDGWWGAGEEPETEEEKTVRPFKIEASEEMLKDLHAPIDLTRWTAPLEDIRFHYGFNLTYLQKVASYWRNQYSWQKQVEILNKYPHFKTNIEGTAGFGLISSLVGLAAYILEKLSTWTDAEFCNLEDGGLERNYSLDELLTNIMIYWVSGSIISSMRFYKENLGDGLGHRKHERVKVKVPTGVASFPNELRHAPPVWAEKKYTNIVSFADMPHGGHFAAFEQPEILAADIRQFVGKVERK
ncbi:epoxide hydrolase 1-like isoform X3 [Lissotriton helveticus]